MFQKSKVNLPSSEAQQFDPPLSFLFEEDASTSDTAALIYRLFTNEKIEFTCKCTSVTPSSETPGELLIGTNKSLCILKI